MKLTRNTTPAAPAPTQTAAALLEALDRKRAALLDRDAELHKQQISLEAGGAVPSPPGAGPSLHDKAIEMLNGTAPPGSSAGGPRNEVLYAVLFERQALAQAIEMLRSPIIHAELERVSEQLEEARPAWGEITRRRVLALEALRKANVEAYEFMSTLQRKARTSIVGWFPCDAAGVPFDFVDAKLGGDITDFIDAAVRSGFCSSKEAGR